MKIDGNAVMPAAPAAVWALLTDPARLGHLLPGCERLEPDGPDRFKAAIKFAIAAISGKYAGTLEFADKKPLHSLILKLEGKGLPGFVRGEGKIELVPRGSNTEIRYSGEAQVGGMIASVGQRLLEGVARKIVQQFFDSAAAELKSGAPAPVPAGKPSAPAASAGSSAPPPKLKRR
jgi:carbon monoxide dehydrogenase subunit G